MIMAPFFIRKYGKKNVQIVTNIFKYYFHSCNDFVYG